jgi:TetR/AcrR family transcriptional regulator, mexJK operon transcriptional repressor
LTQVTDNKAANKRQGDARKPSKTKQVFEPKRGRPTADQAAAISTTILTAANHLILNQGYEATTMEAIAKSAGVPKSTLYKRYPDKLTLLRAVVEERMSAWGSTSASRNVALANDIEGRLKQRLHTVLFWYATEEVRAFTRLALGVGEGAKIVAQVMNEVGNSAMINQLEQDILEFGGIDGKPAKNAKTTAEAFMALLAGWVATRPPDKSVTQEDAAAFADRAVELIIHGRASW